MSPDHQCVWDVLKEMNTTRDPTKVQITFYCKYCLSIINKVLRYTDGMGLEDKGDRR